jgi:hypothetical protein
MSLQDRLSNNDVFLLKEEVREIRSTVDPVFYVYLKMEMVDMPPVTIEKL